MKAVIQRDTKSGGDCDIVTVWQSCDENEVPNEAIIVEQFVGCIQLRQRDNTIVIDANTVPIICQLLKEFSKKGAK